MLQVSRADETSFVVTFFRPGIGKVNMETIYGILGNKIGQKNSGIGADYPHVCQAPSADTVNCVAVVFTGPFDTEEIVTRPGACLIKQEGPFAGTDFDMDRAGTSENPDKIDFALYALGF